MTHVTIQRGTEGVILRVAVVQRDGSPVTGIRLGTPGVRVSYIRNGEAAPTVLDDPAWLAGPSGSPLLEIDPSLMPGLYELRLPDEVCAAGAQRATLVITAPDAMPAVVDIDLVAYDPYDGFRLGLESLSREARHEVISRAFREVVPEIVDEFRRNPVLGPRI